MHCVHADWFEVLSGRCAEMCGDFAVQAMRIKHGMKFKMMAVGLRMAGHKKVADMIKSSWKVCHSF